MARLFTGFRGGGERFTITFEFDGGRQKTVSVAEDGATDLLSKRSFYKEQGVLDAKAVDIFSVDENNRLLDYQAIEVQVKILFRKGFETAGFESRALNESDIPIEGSAIDDRLRGWSGNDLIRGFDGDDVLRGDRGRDRLNGGDGDDVLNGGRGSDLLIGGRGADRFVFSPGDDEIRGFKPGKDVLDLRPTDEIESFSEFRAAARNSGDNLIVTIDRDRLLLLDVQESDLDRDDFLF
ncbi:MAG: hypothetical protein AAF192_23260 [Pseudomonadota bacterium]